MSRRTWARCATCYKATYICARRGCVPVWQQCLAYANPLYSPRRCVNRKVDGSVYCEKHGGKLATPPTVEK